MKTALTLRVLRHVLFWLALWGFFLLIQLPEHFAHGRKIFWREYLFMQVPLSLVTIYPLLYGLLPRLVQGRQLGQVLAWLAGGLVAVAGLSGLLHSFHCHVVLPQLFGEPENRPFSWQEVTGGLNFGFFASVLIAGLAGAIKGVSYWYAQQQLSEQLEQRRLQTELQLLKAQLQPLFLFDTLRTLRQLTTQKSPDSPAAVLHLSGLLRYMLYESPEAAVPLPDEVEMMRHYVALEELRLGSRVEVSLSFSGALDGYTIAPLLLLPFLENAFRHGTGPALECPWISIDLVAKKNLIIFKLINSQVSAEAGWREGNGLRTIRQRLAHLYPARHELKILTDADTFLVVLQVQLTPAAATVLPPAPTEPPRPAELAAVSAHLQPVSSR